MVAAQALTQVLQQWDYQNSTALRDERLVSYLNIVDCVTSSLLLPTFCLYPPHKVRCKVQESSMEELLLNHIDNQVSSLP